jgi:hypothetical protein
MSGGVIKEHTARRGGGVYVTNGGTTFTMSGGVIKENNVLGGTDDGGGGVYITGGGVFTMSGDAVIEGNSCSDGLGVASNDGGGVCVAGGVFTMSGGVVNGNNAFQGGGVSVKPLFAIGNTSVTTFFTKTGGTIMGNTASSGQNVVVFPNGKKRDGTVGDNDNLSAVINSGSWEFTGEWDE